MLPKVYRENQSNKLHTTHKEHPRKTLETPPWKKISKVTKDKQKITPQARHTGIVDHRRNIIIILPTTSTKAPARGIIRLFSFLDLWEIKSPMPVLVKKLYLSSRTFALEHDFPPLLLDPYHPIFIFMTYTFMKNKIVLTKCTFRHTTECAIVVWHTTDWKWFGHICILHHFSHSPTCVVSSATSRRTPSANCNPIAVSARFKTSSFSIVGTHCWPCLDTL